MSPRGRLVAAIGRNAQPRDDGVIAAAGARGPRRHLDGPTRGWECGLPFASGTRGLGVALVGLRKSFVVGDGMPVDISEPKAAV